MKKNVSTSSINVGDKITGKVNGAVGIVKEIKLEKLAANVKRPPKPYAVIEWQNVKKSQQQTTATSLDNLKRLKATGGIKIKSKTSSSTRKQKAPRQNPFAGADDIYLTPNKIAVTTTKNTRTKRGFKQTKQTKYYEQNDSNTRLLKKANRNTVRVGRTGNNYRTI